MKLMAGFSPSHYIVRAVSLLIGCFILAFGVFVELSAGVAMISYDAFVRTLADLLKKPYGKVRTVSDLSFVLAAALTGLVFVHRLLGVREGTLIAAFLTGQIMRVYAKRLEWIRSFISK